MIRNNIFILKFIWKHHKPQFFIRFILLIINGIMPTALILITRKILIDIENVTDINSILYLIILFNLIQFIPNLIFPWHYILNNRQFRYDLNKEMNIMIFNKIKKFKIYTYNDPQFYDIYSRGLKEVDERAWIVFNNIMDFLSQIISIISIILVVLAIKPIILILCIISVIIEVIFETINNDIEYKNEYSIATILRKINYTKRVLYEPEYVADIHTNLTLLQVFINKFETLMNKLKNICKKVDIKKSILASIQAILINSINFFVFYIMCKGVINKEIILVDFISLQSLINNFTLKLKQFFFTLSSFYINSLYIENINQILNLKEDNEEKEIYNQINFIKIENLYFSYSSNENVINNFNTIINKKDKIFIYGENGTGKSTFLKILLKSYNSYKGKIYINNIELKNIKIENHLSHFGVLFQNAPLYSVSIAQYIFEGKYSPEKIKELYKLLRIVNLYEKVISLNKGIYTILSTEFDKDGIELSSGERQKLQIARALAKNGQALIFDEPFSNIDKETAIRILENILEEYENKIIILISHDLSMKNKFEKNFYFTKEGNIFECVIEP